MMWTILLTILVVLKTATGQGDVPPVGSEYNDKSEDGSYRYGFQTGDHGAHYQAALANPVNQVVGRFGSRDPAKGGVVETRYTAGRRGFRAEGPNIARKMSLSQAKIPYNPPVNPNSPGYNPTYDTYFDPNEDPSYSFAFRTPTYSKQEVADSRGYVNGQYYFLDDIGERHDVTYEAGAKIGFNVKTPYPDSKTFPGLFYSGPPSKTGGNPRGKTSIQRGNDGSYRFIAAGPDQRRTETSDARGNVRGSYTYIDDKGQQRTVEYIAGPNIGYRVLKKGIGANLPPAPPFLPPPPVAFTEIPDILPPVGPGVGASSFGDVFETDFTTPRPILGAGSTTTTPRPIGPPGGSYGSGSDSGSDSWNNPSGLQGGSWGGTGNSWNSPGGSGGSTFGGGGSGGSTFGGGGPGGSTFGGGGPGGNTFGGGGSGGSTFGGGGPGGSTFGGGGPGGSTFGGGGNVGSWNQGFTSTTTTASPPFTTFPPSTPTTSFPSSYPSTQTTTPYPSSFPSSTYYPSTPSPPPNTQRPFTGYPSNRPDKPFPLPNNCCGPPASSRPPFGLYDQPSAFPEDDPNRRPLQTNLENDFLTQPFSSFEPKEFHGFNYYRPLSTSRPSTIPDRHDSTFLSSNKNYFAFPTGVAVRAHIQSLDILPFGSRIPSPGVALESQVSPGKKK